MIIYLFTLFELTIFQAINCTTDPWRVANNAKGHMDWDTTIQNKSLLHEVTYTYGGGGGRER